jgi:hypothetical protein
MSATVHHEDRPAYNAVPGRIIHDADAHIMETPSWLRDHADPGLRDRIEPLRYPGGNELRQTGEPAEQQRDLATAFERLAERHRSEDYRSVEAAEIMLRKNFAATGAFLPEDRGRALDLLGFSSQLVFNTFHNRRLYDWEHSGDVAVAYGAARAHNRGMLGRPTAAAYLLRAARRLRLGPGHGGRVPGRRSRRPAGGVGLPGRPLPQPPPARPRVGGRGRGRVGVIEQGAIWLPSWMRQMESAVEAFGRHEERLRALTMRPSEYVRRQARVTPYPTEDVGWIVGQAGPEVCLFSSDYPHVEGGRKPIERFEASLDAAGFSGASGDDVRRRFYCDNFLDLMGRAGAALAR